MLEEVGEAVLPGTSFLDRRHTRCRRDDRGQMVFRDDQPQAVGQSLVGEPDGGCGHSLELLEEGAAVR